jgi:hypothetical protein
VLAEIGDDRDQFSDDRTLQAFAGSAPVTRASGKSRTVTRRRTKSNRLAAVGYPWAFTAASRPSPEREHYLRRRERGDGHPTALRHLFNRWLRQLHHCLTTWQAYHPAKAFPSPTSEPAEPAAAWQIATSEVSSAAWPGSRTRWGGSGGRLDRRYEGSAPGSRTRWAARRWECPSPGSTNGGPGASPLRALNKDSTVCPCQLIGISQLSSQALALFLQSESCVRHSVLWTYWF